MNRLIVALDRSLGMAKNGGMPWNIPEDEAFFSEQTKTYGANVLSGGATFREAYKSKPLKERQNYIATHSADPIESATVVNDLNNFLREFKQDLWVAGGAAIFQEVMAAGQADELYITHIDADFGCDRFFPEFQAGFKLVSESEPGEQNGFRFKYCVYTKK